MIYFLILLFIALIMTLVNISNMNLKMKFEEEIENFKREHNVITQEYNKTMEELKLKEKVLNDLVDNSQKLIHEYDILTEVVCEELGIEKVNRLIIERKNANKPKDLNEFLKKVKEEK